MALLKHLRATNKQFAQFLALHERAEKLVSAAPPTSPASPSAAAASTSTAAGSSDGSQPLESSGLLGLLQAPLKRVPYYIVTLQSLMKRLLLSDFSGGAAGAAAALQQSPAAPPSEHAMLSAAVQVALDQLTKQFRDITDSIILKEARLKCASIARRLSLVTSCLPPPPLCRPLPSSLAYAFAVCRARSMRTFNW
jgi:hypothetical protein